MMMTSRTDSLLMVPFVTHCGVTCNPTSAEQLRDATYSKGEAGPTSANPHLNRREALVRSVRHFLSGGAVLMGPPRAYRLHSPSLPSPASTDRTRCKPAVPVCRRGCWQQAR